MATSTDELKRLEEKAAEHLLDEAGHVEEDLEAAADAPSEEEEEPERPAVRLAIAVLLPTIAAALMVGGVFSGFAARIYAVLASILGVGLALGLRNVKKPVLLNLAVIGGLFGIGLLMVLSEPGKIIGIQGEVQTAINVRKTTRPPAPLTAGWQAIIGWLMGIVGFGAAWVAIALKKPALALLLPLPVAAIAGISVPESQQVATGIAALALFAFGLGVLSSAQAVGPDDEKMPASYEIKRVLRSLPLVAVIVALLFGASQLGFLFPDQLVEPDEKPQKPKTVPISEVEDRVLFEVASPITGPWRTGGLDVYDESDGSWRLPPFADSTLKKVPSSGIVDDKLNEQQGQDIAADFKVLGLTGAVLPGLPNTVGIKFTGQRLAYDGRNGNIRLAEGTVTSGIEYTVTAPELPKVEDLEALGNNVSIPKDVRQFTELPDMPPAVRDLIASAPQDAQDSLWEKFDFVRTWVLDEVTAAGPGVPKNIPPERVQAIITEKEATPYEIVATQAMLARWLGLPSRIAYGFDGGEAVEKDGKKVLEVRPRNGISFVEVYFPGFKWLPIIGTPKKAKAEVTPDQETQFDPNVLPSNDIAVQIFVPTLVPPKSIFYKQLRQIVLIAVPLILLALLIYSTYPAFKKAIVRSRRRAAAEAAGPRARIALSYSEWRDYATDFGFRYPTDTPLMFLDRFIDDDEHTEFAWLVTRALWGDLQDDVNLDMAASAEELSRALRRRLSSAQPGTVRAVSLVSRLSLRHPYAPETDLTSRRKEDDRVALPV